MKKFFILFIFAVTLFAGCNKVKEVKIEKFDSTDIGAIPFGWMMGSTGQKSLGIWEVVDGKMVHMRYPRGSRGEQYNLLYTKDLYFLNGTVEAKIKPDVGREDKVGGVVWRLRDRKNYYMANIDFLSKKLNILKVVKSKIEKIYEKDIDIKNGWNRLRVKFCDKLIEVYINDKLVAKIEDNSINTPGGAGIVTKGNSKTFFDDIKIEVFK